MCSTKNNFYDFLKDWNAKEKKTAKIRAENCHYADHIISFTADNMEITIKYYLNNDSLSNLSTYLLLIFIY